MPRELIDVVKDKDQIIPLDLWEPQNTDIRFTQGVIGGSTIFIDPSLSVVQGAYFDEVVKSLNYRSSDYLFLEVLNKEVRKRAEKKALSEAGNIQSARFVENMLRILFDNPDLWVGHIKAGFNHDGCTSRSYGFLQYNPY